MVGQYYYYTDDDQEIEVRCPEECKEEGYEYFLALFEELGWLEEKEELMTVS